MKLNSLEAEADEILKDRPDNDYPYLLEDQLLLRHEREKLLIDAVWGDFPRHGLYRRVGNPKMGRRPTSQHRLSRRQDPWRQDYHEFSGDEVAGAWIPSATRYSTEGGQHYTWDLILPHHDPKLQPPADPNWFLDRLQRSRIRAAVRRGERPADLARHYGVPIRVIDLLTPEETT